MSATGIKEQYFDYALFYNNATCMSDISCSGLSVFNINTYINSLSSNTYLNVSGLSANLNFYRHNRFFILIILILII